MKHAIVFERVSFSYPEGPRVLDDVSLAVPEGAFVLVTGATGTGKSTLLRAMNGLVPHFSGGTFSGRVTVAERATDRHPPRFLADRVAFVPQDPGAAFVVDRVEDELAYGLENLGAAPAMMRRRVEETLDLLDIEELRARSAATLSGGERQRVAIAAALTPGPRVLLLDEPTSQLDPQGAEDVLAALQRLVHDLGLTVVIAEHRLERVAGFVDLAIGCYGRGRLELGAPGDVLATIGSGPPVASLGRLLGWQPLPLTVREARRRAAGVSLPRPPARRSPPPGRPVLSARGLSVTYERPVLRGIDVELRSGEVVALMGRNGAGKTTLLRTLVGLVDPASGAVSMAGGRRVRPGRDVALCPQTPEEVLFRDSAAAEIETTLAATSLYLDTSPAMRGPSPSKRGEPVYLDPSPGMRASSPSKREQAVGPRARAWLERLGIADLGPRHPRDLSAGERLLVAVAAMAATGAPVLLLDEPTRGLDPGSKERLATLVRAHAGGGNAVMFATHDVELVAALAGRVVMLAGGEVIADGGASSVLGDSPVFAPQTARVFGPEWLTPAQVAAAVGGT